MDRVCGFAATENYSIEKVFAAPGDLKKFWYWVKDSKGNRIKRCTNFYQAERRAYYLDGRLDDLIQCPIHGTMKIYCCNDRTKVYTDGIHMMCQHIGSLHIMADFIGLKRCWFDANPKHPHYDYPKTKRQYYLTKAINLGAIMVTSKELVRIYKSWKRPIGAN
jgi:hypothetical protein